MSCFSRRWGSLALLFLATVAGADAPLPAITNPEAIAPWLRAAATGRADVVCLGDSNQLQQNSGWDHGWIKALDERFGLYATGLLSPGENAGNGAGSGYEYSVASTISSGQFFYSGAPLELDRYLEPGIGMAPLNYLYVPPEQVAGAGISHGLFIERFSGIDVNAPLRFHVTFGTFDSGPPGGGGSFQLSVRQAAAPFQTLATGAAHSTAGGGLGVASIGLDLPAATRETLLNLRFSPFDQSITGPFIAYYVRAENRARPVGVSLHTLYALGGRSARHMAEALLAADMSYLTLFFQKVRELQGPSPRILVRINSGLNDRNEVRPSILSGILPGDSAEAFLDNLHAIVFRIKVVWLINDWPEDELFFLFTVSHPVGNPDDAQLESYREVAAAFASESPRCAAINLGALTAWGEMVDNGWYQFGGFDTNHLTVPGYEVLSAREVAALEDGACWRDLNADRTLDSEDLYEWHRLRPDLDGDGKSNFLDLRCLEKAARTGESGDVSSENVVPRMLP